MRDVSPSLGARIEPDNSVTFTYRDAGASRVLCAGDFTHWAKDPVPLTRKEGTDLWTLHTRPLPAGLHAYKYIVDGRWIPDPENPLDIDDGVGGRNSAIVVGGRNLGDPAAIRVLSLNLHTYQERGSRGGKVVNDSLEKLERIAFGVAAMGIDVLLLQEVGEHVANPAEPNAGKVLQKHLQRFTRQTWAHEWREAHIGFDVYREGVSLLSSGPLDDVFALQLSQGPLARIALFAKTTVKGKNLRVGTTHVAWGAEGGLEVAKLLEGLSSAPRGDFAATLVAGDFNAAADEPQVARFIEKGFIDVALAAKKAIPTFGEKSLLSRIDYQFLRAAVGHKPAKIEAFARVFDGEGPEDGLDPRVSDHAGLVAAYRWD